jgi:hypothetical protein
MMEEWEDGIFQYSKKLLILPSSYDNEKPNRKFERKTSWRKKSSS